jgi:hypothetical protein
MAGLHDERAGPGQRVLLDDGPRAGIDPALDRCEGLAVGNRVEVGAIEVSAAALVLPQRALPVLERWLCISGDFAKPSELEDVPATPSRR